MNSIYPTNLPGLAYFHDPTKLNYKHVINGISRKKIFGEIEPSKLYSLPTIHKTNSTINNESPKEYEPNYVK